MKTKILLIIALCFTQTAFATEADLLREGCAALKTSAKKTQCLAALDSLINSNAPVPPKAESLAKLRPNLRAMQCEAFEFSELDSFKKDELESASCSYQLGIEISDKSTEKVIAQQSDPKVTTMLLQRKIAMLDKCGSGMQKVDNLFQRKFPDAKMDCSKMRRATPNSTAPQDSASQ